jgi:hypothetical protein
LSSASHPGRLTLGKSLLRPLDRSTLDAMEKRNILVSSLVMSRPDSSPVVRAHLPSLVTFNIMPTESGSFHVGQDTG